MQNIFQVKYVNAIELLENKPYNKEDIKQKGTSPPKIVDLYPFCTAKY